MGARACIGVRWFGGWPRVSAPPPRPQPPKEDGELVRIRLDNGTVLEWCIPLERLDVHEFRQWMRQGPPRP